MQGEGSGRFCQSQVQDNVENLAFKKRGTENREKKQKYKNQTQGDAKKAKSIFLASKQMVV